MLQGTTEHAKHRGFRFEAYRIHIQGFHDVVNEAWNKPLSETDALRKMHTKLSRTAKALKLWQKTCIVNIKMHIAIAKEIIWKFDVAEENRVLSMEEQDCRKRIKLKYQGLLAIDKIRAKQLARLTNIKTSHANTKLFYIRANVRKRKKHIPVLQTDHGLVVSHKG